MEYRVRKRNIDESSRGAGRLEDAVLRRFLLRAGFTTTSARTLEYTRNYLSDFLERLLDVVVVLTGHHNRRTILLTDVLRACRHFGIRLYGYDDICVLEGPYGITEYHITEMVEVDMTFNRAADSDEPDHEPSVHYTKTDFVQNQQAWDADADDEEDDDSGDDSEWSWYSESDADSDSEDEEDCDITHRPTPPDSRWRQSNDPNEVFRQSLHAAQTVVDDELLVKEPESGIMDSEAPLGQGYESDCDSSRVPSSHRDWLMSAEHEEAKWESKGNFTEFADSETESASENVAMEDDNDEYHENLNKYVISRQAFMNIFYATLSSGTLRYPLPISAVALSALHNVSEQYLHAAVTGGTLRAQIVSTMMEEQLEATLVERAEREAELQNIQDVEAAMIEMQATFKRKEQEMQRQIADLEQRLRQQHDEPVVDVDMETKPRTSPGKRKASSKDDSVVAKKTASSSSSIVGSLRSRLHEYSLRKKAKISPV